MAPDSVFCEVGLSRSAIGTGVRIHPRSFFHPPEAEFGLDPGLVLFGVRAFATRHWDWSSGFAELLLLAPAIGSGVLPTTMRSPGSTTFLRLLSALAAVSPPAAFS